MAALETAICNFVGMDGATFIITWECVAYRAIEIRRTTAYNCVEMRLSIAWKCAEMGPANAWKCPEPRLAWECELRVRLRTAARVRRTRVGNVREVRLNWGSNAWNRDAWNRGSTHWWVPYLYRTGTLRVKIQFIKFAAQLLACMICLKCQKPLTGSKVKISQHFYMHIDIFNQHYSLMNYYITQ